jgi:ribonuclease Z
VPHKFSTFILGCSAATPTSLRHTTAQLLTHANKHFLLDCAEGTQKQLRRFKLPVMKIDHIFITHLHGDHYLGLMGLLFSLHLMGRTSELTIVSPPGLKQIIELQFENSGHNANYPMRFVTVKSGRQLVYEDNLLTVESEKTGLRNINKKAISKYQIPIAKMELLKRGEDLTLRSGKIIPNREVTLDPPYPRSYAFLSDTGYTESYVDQIKKVNLLYHEATFLSDKTDKARQKMHCTTEDAATIAKQADVGKLLIGHYSARYNDLSFFEKETREIFPDTIIAEEGMEIEIDS